MRPPAQLHQFPAPAQPTSVRRRQGIALISVMMMIAVLTIIITVTLSLTLRETRTSGMSSESMRGFYAAEGGLNKRAADIRLKFDGYDLPTGTGPSSSAPCTGTNLGSGDLGCQTLTGFKDRQVQTYVQDLTKNPTAGDQGTVEAGSPLAGMNYLQFVYRVTSQSVSTQPETNGQTEAKTQMEFQSRLIPIFQFAGFFQNDLELGVGGVFTLHGRLHSNHDVYLGSDNYGAGGATTTNIYSNYPTTVTAAGTFSGSRHNNPASAYPGRAAVNDKIWTNSPPNSLQPLTDAELAALKPDAISGVPPLQPPPLSNLKPSADSDFWRYADLRIVAVPGGLFGGYIMYSRNYDGSINYVNTFALNTCRSLGNSGTSHVLSHGSAFPLVATVSNTLYDGRENRMITSLDIDQNGLMQCIASGRMVRDDGTPLRLNDTTNGGLVIHASFEDPNATGPGYGVRIQNASQLGTGQAGIAQPKGLTFVSDQPVYLEGDYNAVNKIPSAIMGDAINVLSNAWDESKRPWNGLQNAADTTVNAGLLSGSDLTVPFVSDGGGMQNFLRLHENWGGHLLTFKGSIVSLGTTLHTRGAWCQGNSCYWAPKRNFDYDTAFDSASTLPPLTPNVVYLRQLVFSRQYQ